MRTLLASFVLASFAGCSGHPAADVPRGESASSSAACTVPGVERAHRVEPLTLPSGCSFTGGGPPGSPLVVHSAEELASALTCTGTDGPAIDWGANDLLVIQYAMSPAYAGSEVFDDGTTVTFATRFRSPCPSDPLPMPMSAALAFLLPKGAERAFREATCTNPERCP